MGLLRRQYSLTFFSVKKVFNIKTHKNGFDKKSKFISKFVYSGSSMHGTLRKGDITYAKNPPLQSIIPGDIIVYADQAHDEHKTIHRVVSISPEGLITQGDNCHGPDAFPVTEQELIGKVSFIDRERKLRPIAEGYAGIRHATRLRIINKFRIFLHPLLHPLYFIMGERIARGLKWQPEIYQIKIITLAGVITKYVHNNKTIAYWNPRIEEWYCRKPYDLILKKPE